MSTGEKLIQMVIEQGIEQGQIIGSQQLLIKLLEQRFGLLTEIDRNTVINCNSRNKLESASIAFAENKTRDEVIVELV